MTPVLTHLAAVLLGILTGAMLLVGVAFVPYWGSMDPAELAPWFAGNAPLIGRLMVPLGAAATLVAVLAAVAARRSEAFPWLALAAASAIALGALYPLYYAEANELLASGSLSSEQVAVALRRWEAWHWARVGAGLLAFSAALRALSIAGDSQASS